MDPSTIETILQLPIIGILIWLLIREQAEKERLLAQLILQAQQHSEHLVQMACHGYMDKEKM